VTPAQAQVNLEKATADLKESKIETAKAQLLMTRAEGRKLKRQLDAALAEFRQHDAEAQQAEIDRVDISNAIRGHMETKPDAADFPSDEELRAWQMELDRLTAERTKACERKTAAEQASAQPRMDAIRLDAALNTLRHRQAQLEAIVRGEKVGGGWEGYVSPVS
jgi:hypothetical protein